MADVVPHMPDGDVHAGVVMGGNRRFHLIAVHRLNDEFGEETARSVGDTPGTRKRPVDRGLDHGRVAPLNGDGDSGLGWA